VGCVKQIIGPLFVVFEFFELSEHVLEDIVNKFVEELR
jgi:hypothetical protein